ncbi:MAG: polyprenyl synthetase family protein [Thermoleophilia bacterium]
MEQFRGRYLPLYGEAMAECERRLARIAAQPSGLLGDSCAETLAAGGKRLRPLLVLLSSPGGAQPDEVLYDAAVAVELVHMATLVHDDVLDNAELRRGQPTLVARYGAAVSTCAGDYLFSSAFGVLSRAASRSANEELSRAILGLSRGELLQMRQAYDYGITREEYFERCRLKTSGLFSAACRLGAGLSGAGDKVVGAVGEYGDCLGTAFQITDDILDFSGDASRFGKSIGTDLRDGTVTLPLIIAIERDAALPELLAGEITEELVSAVCGRIHDCGALEESARTAYGYVGQAREALGAAAGVIDAGPLELIAAAAVERNV